jgi:hypothetical protein
MLPILRILPVGGVLLAILILVLALSPPDGSRSQLTTTIAPARGALVDRERHPEVRQFLIRAALKRADELNRLRELPDTPARSNVGSGAAKIAGLPGGDAQPDDTGTINESPSVSIPIEIGERSSTELPVQEESGPAVKASEPAKVRRRNVHRTRRTKISAPAPQPFLFFFFNGQQQQPTGAKQTTQPSGTYQAYQTSTGNQASQSYGVNQPGPSSGTKQASQSANSYTNFAPPTNSY